MVTIRNRNTHAAYLRAACDVCAFATARGASALRELTPMHVAVWVETGGVPFEPSLSDALQVVPPSRRPPT